MEREFNLQYYMNLSIRDQRRMDVRMLDWHYERLFEQKRSEKEDRGNNAG